jgi:hypothetical protein
MGLKPLLTAALVALSLDLACGGSGRDPSTSEAGRID